MLLGFDVTRNYGQLGASKLRLCHATKRGYKGYVFDQLFAIHTASIFLTFHKLLTIWLVFYALS